MKEIFERSLELNGLITDIAGKLDIVSIDINSAMRVYLKNGKKSKTFLAERFVELAEEMAKYGIIEKEWEDE